MSKVQVLLSSYNGERFIAQQLDSILNQIYSNIHILVRDDGSTDSTKAIVHKYVKQYPGRIDILEGENVGVISSFMLLVEASDPEASYYCFCDQDDVWLTHKVNNAIQRINNKCYPVMLCTATQMTDAELNPLGIWPSEWKRDLSFYNALFQNVAVGTTITINKAARDLIVLKQVNSRQLLMHDWWVYIVVSAFGEVIFDKEPSILYRQHENNVVGGNKSFLHKVKKKWQSYLKHSNHKLLINQAQEMFDLYGEKMTEDKKEQLKMFLAPRDTFVKRIRYVRKCKLYRQSWLEQRLFQILILIGYI